MQFAVNRKYRIIVLVFIIISIIFGIITHDLLVGGTILATGLLSAYFASEGHRISYILSFINYILMGYVSLKNNLYGIFFFYIVVFAPLQIQGFFAWKKNQRDDNRIEIREFTFRTSIIITLSCIVGSFLLGYLLSQIPNQQLAFMDAVSNCINLCGVILMMLRFKEAWWLWLVNNIIDFIIWIIIAHGHGEGSMMMLLTSVGYLLINIYGVMEWSIEAKKTSSL